MAEIYGLIGYPVKHSLSPAMHNAAFKHLGLDARYRLFEIPPQELEAFLTKKLFSDAAVKDVLREDIPAKDWEMDSFDVKFTDDINIDCKFTKINREIISDVAVTTHRDITCSRCLSQVNQTVEHNFKKYYM